MPIKKCQNPVYSTAARSEEILTLALCRESDIRSDQLYLNMIMRLFVESQAAKRRSDPSKKEQKQ